MCKCDARYSKAVANVHYGRRLIHWKDVHLVKIRTMYGSETQICTCHDHLHHTLHSVAAADIPLVLVQIGLIIASLLLRF